MNFEEGQKDGENEKLEKLMRGEKINLGAETKSENWRMNKEERKVFLEDMKEKLGSILDMSAEFEEILSSDITTEEAKEKLKNIQDRLREMNLKSMGEGYNTAAEEFQKFKYVERKRDELFKEIEEVIIGNEAKINKLREIIMNRDEREGKNTNIEDITSAEQEEPMRQILIEIPNKESKSQNPEQNEDSNPFIEEISKISKEAEIFKKNITEKTPEEVRSYLASLNGFLVRPEFDELPKSTERSISWKEHIEFKKEAIQKAFEEEREKKNIQNNITEETSKVEKNIETTGNDSGKNIEQKTPETLEISPEDLERKKKIGELIENARENSMQHAENDQEVDSQVTKISQRILEIENKKNSEEELSENEITELKKLEEEREKLVHERKIALGGIGANESKNTLLERIGGNKGVELLPTVIAMREALKMQLEGAKGKLNELPKEKREAVENLTIAQTTEPKEQIPAIDENEIVEEKFLGSDYKSIKHSDLVLLNNLMSKETNLIDQDDEFKKVLELVKLSDRKVRVAKKDIQSETRVVLNLETITERTGQIYQDKIIVDFKEIKNLEKALKDGPIKNLYKRHTVIIKAESVEIKNEEENSEKNEKKMIETPEEKREYIGEEAKTTETEKDIEEAQDLEKMENPTEISEASTEIKTEKSEKEIYKKITQENAKKLVRDFLESENTFRVLNAQWMKNQGISIKGEMRNISNVISEFIKLNPTEGEKNVSEFIKDGIAKNYQGYTKEKFEEITGGKSEDFTLQDILKIIEEVGKEK